MKFPLKKLLSLFLAASLLITSLVGVFPVMAAETTTDSLSGKSVLVSGDSIAAGWRDLYSGPEKEISIWEEGDMSEPKDSDSDGVYEITNGAELAYAIYYSGTIGDDTACSFILTDDIYLNDIDKVNWETGKAEDGYVIRSWYRNWISSTHSIAFEGTIDGNYHTVYGLYYVNYEKDIQNSQEGSALIPKAKGSATTTIKNLAIDNAFVSHYSTASAFVALADESAVVNMSNCYAGESVTLIGRNAAAFRGRGWASHGATLENCYSLATTTTLTDDGCYGLVGYLYEVDSTKVSFKNCYNSEGPLSWGEAAGYYCTAENCFETVASMRYDGEKALTTGVTILSSDNMKGSDVLTSETKMLGLSTDVYTATDSYPTLTCFAKNDDTIVSTDNSNGKGWGLRLQEEYGMTVTNAAVAGSSFTEIAKRKRILAQLTANKSKTYDYVLLQGGFNDAMGENVKPSAVDNAEIAPYGEISDSYNVDDFDITTFAGALEEYFYYAKKYFPTAKIGFIVTYQTPCSQYGGRTADVTAMRTQWDLAKKICDKWDISYLDMFDGCNEAGVAFSSLLDVANKTSAYFPTNNDNIHLNTAGYDLVTPEIAGWMLGLTVPEVTYEETENLISLDFEEKYLNSSDSSFYGYTNMSVDNKRGSYVDYYSEEDGNTAMKMSWDTDNSLENYNANAAFSIYDTSTKERFFGEADKSYTIKFEYKVVDADDKSLQFYIGYCNREHFMATDLGNNYSAMAQASASSYIPFITVGDAITAETDGYVKASVTFTANGTYYPIILLSCNGKVKDDTKTSESTFATVLVDNVEVAEVVESTADESLDYTLDFEGSYTTDFYKTIENSSYANNRGSNAIGYTEADGNTAMQLTWDTDNSLENYNANAAITIYNPSNSSKFIGEADKDYTISFDYKVLDADDKSLQFYVGYCGRTSLKNSDLNNNSAAMAQSGTYLPFITVGDAITEENGDYVTLTFKFTAHGTYYPILILSCNGKVKDENKTAESTFASVLVDNIRVRETTSSTVKLYNYGGQGNHTQLTVTNIDTFASLETPSCKGYLFDGWYKDAGLTLPISSSEFVCNYKNVYVKWFGGGNILSPSAVTDTVTIGDIKAFSTGYGTHTFTLETNSMLEAPGGSSVSKYYGSNILSSDTVLTDSTEQYYHDGLLISLTSGVDEVIFYVEIPDYEKAGEDWALGLAGNGLCLKQVVDSNNVWIALDKTSTSNKFEYIKDNAWVESNISTDGHFNIPSGYKGYVKLDITELSWEKTIDFTSEYWLNQVQFTVNAVGGECGDMVFGGLFYAPSVKNESTVMQIDTTCYEMYGNSDTVVVNAYDSTGGSFSTRYQGTAGSVAATLTDGDTSAFFTKPSVITSADSNVVSTKGYMNTYELTGLGIIMQPAVDTLMFYVELPEFDATSAALKLLDPTVAQGSNTATISFSNSIYKYMDVENGCWRIARAGADGELSALPSGFKGYIKVDLKYFKNFSSITNIDFSQLYSIVSFGIGFNHFGGANGSFVLGGLYSVIVDSNSYFITNGLTTESLCARVFGGDFNCDAVVDWDEITQLRKILLGEEIGGAAKLRADIFRDGSEPDITSLVKLKNCVENADSLVTGEDVDNGVVYKNIFSNNYSDNTTSTVYDIVKLDPTVDSSLYAGVIEADTELNYEDKAIAFADEITNGFVGDFEKTGIDLMCHVSTFCYAKGNIYMTYYANTMSASENPTYQVARLAYAPEDNTENKVILDIMLVGDDLYGQKVTGVYDTILMQKEDDPDNLYILWTASVQGKYYRLYRTFNMVTEELGEIGVNKFKVGDISNDFSDSGIKNALAENGIGYKETFSDIGIMQKLSTRVENGETYYYTGAYSGNFTCIIKSKDLITWEYVAQPNEGANDTGFENATKWENAVYVVGDKAYYFVRQWDATDTNGSAYGILTSYDLITGEWATPVLVGDCQSRSDFIMYGGELYLFYAPTDRSHIGILKINTENLAESEVVLQAQMNSSCFYPFVQYNSDGELCMSYTVSRKHIRLASFKLSDYLGDEITLAPEEEFSAVGDSLEIPIDIQAGYHYGDPAVNDTIQLQADSSWSCASFSVNPQNTYTVTFTSAEATDAPYIYLCDGNGVIKELIQAEAASATNEITFTVTDETVETVYVRSSSADAECITVKQVIDGNSTLNMDSMEQLKVEISTPYKYSAWPMIGVAGDKLVAFYTLADQHSATESSIYMKTSTTNGLTWTEGKEFFTEKTKVKGITGVGQDSEGNMLIWYRDGSPAAWNTTHELYKTDGRVVTKVSAPDFALRGGHIGNIISVEGTLLAFYNTYGDTRSWGVLKSTDDGLTWTQTPIEENIAKAECPVEIEGVYLGDGKILLLGRKDASEGTIAMFQMQSTDYGETWTKEYTNITDAYGSSPSILLDSETNTVTLYFFARSSGQFIRRVVNVADVWDNPLNWADSEILITEPYKGQDTGNVKTVVKDGLHFCTYYAGTSSLTGIYGVIINPVYKEEAETVK